MATNTDQLRQGLDEYRSGLEKQVQQLQSDFEEIKGLYQAVNSHYEGTAAEEFRQNWEKTGQWFDEYISRTKQMTAFLEERTRQLDGV